MPDIFIELDRDFDAIEEPPPRPSRFGRRWRPWAAAGLVAVVLATLGSAGLRPSSPLELVAEFAAHPTAQLISVGSRLLVHEPDLLRSIELSSGKVTWQTRTDIKEGYLGLRGDLLILTGHSGLITRDGPPPSASMAVEAATGVIRWQIPGNVEMHDDFMISYEAAELPPQDIKTTITVYSTDAKPIWSIPPGQGISAPNIVRSLMGTLDPATGELVERNLRTGEETNRYTFPELKGAEGLYYNDSVAFIFFNNGRTLSFDGISVTDPVTHDLGFGGPEPFDCGQVWCRQKADGPGFYLTDKVSGRKVYEISDWEIIARVESGILGLRYPNMEGPVPALTHFEPGSGKVTELRGWSMLSLRFLEARTPVVEGPAYMWSYKNELDYFGILRQGAVSIIGVLPHTGELRFCQVDAPYLACMIGADLVRIWRLP